MRFLIDDLEVLFPFDYVYPEQLEYMRSLKRSLGKGHSVLEMPTGTGKTITLLSLLLSYQYKHPEVGKLVYCTRTVHEMTKVVAELKNLMKFREQEILKDQIAFKAQYPDAARLAIDALSFSTSLSSTQTVMESIANRTSTANAENTDMTDTPGTVGFSKSDVSEDAVSVRIHTHKAAISSLTSHNIDLELATRAVNTMRSPNILGVCLSSRRNMCIHPVVSQFDHRERVDALCRGMTAPFVREQALNKLAQNTQGSNNTADADVSVAGSDGCGSCPNNSSPSVDVAAALSSITDIEDMGSLGLCSYYEGYMSTGTDATLTGIYDIEDIKKLGAERHWCPYYTARKMISNSNVIVYNYHYMLDPKIAGMISKEIEKESIIVFDEAHNIDNICIEALSITVNKNDIYSASRNLSRLRMLVQNAESSNNSRLQDEYNKLVSGMIQSGVLDSSVTEIASAPLLPDDIAKDAIPGSIRRAKHFIVFLKTLVEYVKIRIDGKEVKQETTNAFIKHFQHEVGLGEVSAMKFAFDRLGLLLKTLEISDVDEYTPLLKLCSLATLVSTYDEGFVVLFEPNDDNNIPDARLKLCCVDSSLAIKPVFDKYSSVVITSGTLSPMDMYPKMLGFKPIVADSFTMSLSRNVVLPLIISKGNDQNPVSTSFSLRENQTVALNYGHLVISLAKNIPDGMVVFFTSYSYMERILAQWTELGILQEILKHKLIFLETKDIEETTLALAAYKKACTSGRGGLFFSIARGKVSEGIDFSGHLGRAVVLIGVPYQYTRSRVLLARLEYLREKLNIAESDFLHFDALRQTSQCVGRIVRSKTDYGVMVLADQRYSRVDIIRKLPKWIQQFILPEHVSLSTESAIYSSKHFFKSMSAPHNREYDLGVVLLNAEQAQSHLTKGNQMTDF